jgi:hypothetical protein
MSAENRIETVGREFSVVDPLHSVDRKTARYWIGSATETSD